MWRRLKFRSRLDAQRRHLKKTVTLAWSPSDSKNGWMCTTWRVWNGCRSLSTPDPLSVPTRPSLRSAGDLAWALLTRMSRASCLLLHGIKLSYSWLCLTQWALKWRLAPMWLEQTTWNSFTRRERWNKLGTSALKKKSLASISSLIRCSL